VQRVQDPRRSAFLRHTLFEKKSVFKTTGGATNAESTRQKWRNDELGEKHAKRKSVERTADMVQQPHRTKRYRNAKILHSSFLRPLLCCELSRIVVVVSRRIKKGRRISDKAFVGVFLIREK
jgi:hypothetical protein